MNAFSVMSTPDLVVFMREQRGPARPRRHQSCGCAPCRRSARLGAEPEEWSFVGAMARVDANIAAAQAVFVNGVGRPIELAAQKLKAAEQALRAEGDAAIRQGAAAWGDAALVLADRLASAEERLGEGAGAAYRSFMGTSPATTAIVTLGFGLLFLGGAGYLLLSPGGMALAIGGGQALGGAGKALWRVL